MGRSALPKSSRRVVYQPRVYKALQKGINQMVAAVRPTYGPLHGTVILERVDKQRLPEILDDGGVIARRIIELPDRDEDVGAMMVRHLMWRIHERFGDATVTSALIYQSVFNQGVRHIVNGGNPMLLRRSLDKGAQLVMNALSQSTLPVTCQDQLRQLARTLTADQEMAENLSEIITRVGRYGQVEIKLGRSRESYIEYKNGMTWKGEFFLRSMVQDKFKVRSELEDTAILVSNLLIDNPYELAEWLEKIVSAGIKKLILLARDMTPTCLTILEAARRDPENFDVIAVKLWETSERWELQDLAILTGGWMFVREAGYRLATVEPKLLGHAGKIWIERSQFGIIDGGGNPDIIQRHIHQMLAALENAKEERFKNRLKERIAGFAGTSAIYSMGGSTQIEIEERARQAARITNILRSAVADGVLPGGATALLDCLPALEPLVRSEDEEERTAGRIISNALREPLTVLIANCGENPLEVSARMKRRGKGYGFDVHSRKVRKMIDAGILDVASAVKAAAYGGITGAALGLTVEVVVHPKKRKESFTTG
jgi:chaperonin GroEL